eukprot:CAMPEP_0170479694 /NCGR_PEP_ID=MMETSP0208-20121228/828_1 /TAXON_ID=197538 /ORGANISM="Strombidium inclinatum, Strain S3" /LENGTH=117 /DNA_ID=CAMNT_0010752135 /DNA_START=616 /DNA_END=968 /DNA_ORIENTATION=+
MGAILMAVQTCCPLEIRRAGFGNASSDFSGSDFRALTTSFFSSSGLSLTEFEIVFPAEVGGVSADNLILRLSIIRLRLLAGAVRVSVLQEFNAELALLEIDDLFLGFWTDGRTIHII